MWESMVWEELLRCMAERPVRPPELRADRAERLGRMRIDHFQARALRGVHQAERGGRKGGAGAAKCCEHESGERERQGARWVKERQGGARGGERKGRRGRRRKRATECWR